MKHLLLAVLLIAIIAGCSKKDDSPAAGPVLSHADSIRIRDSVASATQLRFIGTLHARGDYEGNGPYFTHHMDTTVTDTVWLKNTYISNINVTVVELFYSNFLLFDSVQSGFRLLPLKSGITWTTANSFTGNDTYYSFSGSLSSDQPARLNLQTNFKKLSAPNGYESSFTGTQQ